MSIVNLDTAFCSWPQNSIFSDSESGKTSSSEASVEQHQIQFCDLLNQINKEIISTLDLDQVLSSACQQLGRILQCSRVSVLVKESHSDQEFITQSEYNSGEYFSQKGIKFSVDDNPHLRITTTCESISNCD